MIQTESVSRSTTTSPALPGGQHCKAVWYLLLMSLLLAVLPARAGTADEAYLQVFFVIQQADALEKDGKPTQALAKYREAQYALQSFQSTNREYYPKVVGYRAWYLTQKLASLEPAPATNAPAPAAAKPELESTSPPPKPQTRATPAAAQVKLLEAGAEPRRVLRLHPKPGDKQTLAVTLKMAVETKMGEVEVPSMKMPGMKMGMDVTVKNVSPEGEISYDVVLGEATFNEEPGAMPQMVEALKTSFSGMKGATGTGTVSDRGINKSTQLKLAANSPQAAQATEQIKQIFADFISPLPEEPVGAGAKWAVTRSFKTQGMTIDHTITCELASLEGEHYTIKNTSTQSAAAQRIQNPAMPGLKVELTKLAGDGTGETGSDLGHLLPAKGVMDSKLQMDMQMDAGGQKQALATKMAMTVALEAR